MTRQGEKAELALDLMVKVKGDVGGYCARSRPATGPVKRARHGELPILNEHVPIKASMENQNP